RRRATRRRSRTSPCSRSCARRRSSLVRAARRSAARLALLPALALAPALALLLPSTASAYERQWHVGASFGFVGAWNGVGPGAAGGLDGGYGVLDWLDLTASVDFAGFPGTKLFVPSGTAGVRFVFDVLQVVPYVGVEAGGAGAIVVGG